MILPPRISSLELFVAEVTGAGLAGHAAHAMAQLPGWVGGVAGGLVVGVVLRVLDPTLRAHGERLKQRFSPAPPAPTPTPADAVRLTSPTSAAAITAALDAADDPLDDPDPID